MIESWSTQVRHEMCPLGLIDRELECRGQNTLGLIDRELECRGQNTLGLIDRELEYMP
jgi:hypothetical protein